MSRRLPPLTALRAFEAAARHLSFTRAGEELHVTQTAISHQIRSLEDYLGLPLFRRHPRGLILTEEAQLFLPPVREAFDRLAQATERLTAARAGGVLTVSVLPSFAAKWLVPRMGRFRAAHPEIDLRISASMQPTDFGRDGVDVAVRRGRGRYPGLRTDWLLEDLIFPVCSPALLDGDPPLREPADLAHHVLLHDNNPVDVPSDLFIDGWGRWLEAAGVADIDYRIGPAFDDASMMLEAAAGGQGVGLGRSVLVTADLAAGRLVKPFDVDLQITDIAYYLVCPEPMADQPKIAAFRDWLLAEAAEHRRAAAAYSTVDRLTETS